MRSVVIMSSRDKAKLKRELEAREKAQQDVPYEFQLYYYIKG